MVYYEGALGSRLEEEAYVESLDSGRNTETVYIIRDSRIPDRDNILSIDYTILIDILLLDVARHYRAECLFRRVGYIRLVDKETFRYKSRYLVQPLSFP